MKAKIFLGPRVCARSSSQGEGACSARKGKGAAEETGKAEARGSQSRGAELRGISFYEVFKDMG